MPTSLTTMSGSERADEEAANVLKLTRGRISQMLNAPATSRGSHRKRAVGGALEEARKPERPWWRRMFGG